MIRVLLERLLGVRRLQDAVFGTLRFQRPGFWEGSVIFSPTARSVEVLVDGGPEGPTDEQRQFLAELSARYAELLPKLVERIAVEVRSGSKVPVSDLQEEALTLVCIDVPRTNVTDGMCGLSFEDARSHYSVRLRDWMPDHVEVMSC